MRHIFVLRTHTLPSSLIKNFSQQPPICDIIIKLKLKVSRAIFRLKKLFKIVLSNAWTQEVEEGWE